MKIVWIAGLVAFCFMSCSENPSSRFQLLPASKTGIDFNNTVVANDTFNILHFEYMYNGGGVGIGDLNNDGFVDVIFTGNKVSTKIYLNKGDLTFTDISGQFPGLDNKEWISGVSMADVNGDGLLDIYLTATSGDDPENRRNQLWVNQGIDKDNMPSFQEKAKEYGIDNDNYSVHSAFLDYDLDGDLDLYVLNNTGIKDSPPNYRPKIVDGSSKNNDAFYENNGDGTFTDVTDKAGILVEGCGLGIAVSDVNKDGYPDLYISNDYISNDLLYVNQGDKTFKNRAATYFSYQSKFSMGNDIADINEDGNPDLITLDMLPKEYARKKQTIGGSSYLFTINDDRYGYEHQYVRNMLQMNNGFMDGQLLPFSEVGQMAGIFNTEWSWSPLFADFDNDGDKDLIITNGFPKDLTDKDFINYKAQMYNYLASEQQMLSRLPEVKVSNFAYERTGGYDFRDATKDWGMNIPSFSNGAAFADLDNDGDLDYVVNNINDPAFIYKNTTVEMNDKTSNFLRLNLVGTGKNTMAIGAKVELWSKGHYQYYEHFLSRGYISSVDPIVHFGLKDPTIDSLLITWPDSLHSTMLKNVKSNQLLTIKESDATVRKPTRKKQIDKGWFKSVSLMNYRHDQENYIDFYDHQYIMPHKFSQIGPCMAKGDLDGDGKDDLLLGASDKLPTTAFLWKNGGFEKTDVPGLTTSKDCIEADLVILDIDQDGDNDVIAVSGGYRNQYQDEFKHYWYENQGGKFVQHKLPLPPFPASVIKPFDYDHDGDLDLFVGSRVKRDYYPYADPSYIIINDNGKLSTNESMTFNIGMVTDAVWSDYDGDGWEDLVIPRELNSVALIKNEAGKSFSIQDNPTVAGKHGFWFSIIAGDFDEDGDDDYMIGNLGKNNKFTVSDKYPMRVYAIDIDANGTLDPISTAYWKDVNGEMKEYPINGYDELASQTPYFKKNFTSYTKFSMANMDDILDRSSIHEENVFSVNTTSSYFLWNDKGKFTWEEMPDKLQTSPIRKMMVMDVNDDKHKDIIVTGNDYSFDASTGFYDANKGLILAGHGTRDFDIVTPSESGMLLEGQVDDLLYFEGSPSYLIAGINRAPLKTFAHHSVKDSTVTKALNY